jgi:hypothetical protein
MSIGRYTIPNTADSALAYMNMVPALILLAFRRPKQR